MGEINGITFSNQAVTPKDDGQLRAYLLKDGIISGCEISYSAATLTVGSGYLIAAGRLMRIPTTIYKSVDQAVGGYARALLTIDLTATATKSEFQQARIDVEYSATINGFPSPTQGDVNGRDSIYQTPLAVMALGSSGIVNIVERMTAALPANAAPKPISTTVMIPASLWVENVAEIDVANIADGSNVIITPHPDSFVMWADSLIRATSQSVGKLSFRCEDVPSEDVKANILIVG